MDITPTGPVAPTSRPRPARLHGSPHRISQRTGLPVMRLTPLQQKARTMFRALTRAGMPPAVAATISARKAGTALSDAKRKANKQAKQSRKANRP